MAVNLPADGAVVKGTLYNLPTSIYSSNVSDLNGNLYGQFIGPLPHATSTLDVTYWVRENANSNNWAFYTHEPGTNPPQYKGVHVEINFSNRTIKFVESRIGVASGNTNVVYNIIVITPGDYPTGWVANHNGAHHPPDTNNTGWWIQSINPLIDNRLQLLNTDVSWNIGKSDCNVENIYTKCLYINNEKLESSTRNIVFRQSDLNTDLTNDTGTNNIQSPTNYKLIIQPTNASSKFRIQLKIGYIIGFRNNQRITFILSRAIGDATSSDIYTDIRITVGNQQDVAFHIYSLDHMDTITNGNSNLSPITYQLKFVLEGTFNGVQDNGNPCGIIGVDGVNGYQIPHLNFEVKSTNSMIVEEIPSGISEYVHIIYTLTVNSETVVGIDSSDWLPVTSLTDTSDFHILSVVMKGARITVDSFPSYGILVRDTGSDYDYYQVYLVKDRGDQITYMARGVRLEMQITSSGELEIKTKDRIGANYVRPPELISNVTTNFFNIAFNSSTETYVESFEYVTGSTVEWSTALTRNFTTIDSNYTDSIDNFHIIEGTLSGTFVSNINNNKFKSDCIILRESSSIWQMYSVKNTEQSPETFGGIRLEVNKSGTNLQVKNVSTIDMNNADPGQLIPLNGYTLTNISNIVQINLASFKYVIGTKRDFNK